MKTFKTSKGTELPLLDLRGKDYLQVAHRLVWFREDHPDWSIQTEIFRLEDKSALAKATIRDASDRIMATSHKCEDVKGFADFQEKAETGAIGRALALCGYGTQFAPDLDEGERIVDSPQARPQTPKQIAPAGQETYRVPFGKKYKGRSLEEIANDSAEGPQGIRSFIQFLEDSSARDAKPLGDMVAEFILQAETFLGKLENQKNDDIPF